VNDDGPVWPKRSKPAKTDWAIRARLAAARVSLPAPPMPYRADTDVDRDLNPRRKAQQIGTGFFEWPLWRAFPTWPQHLERVALARGTATA
jgi:hypothetical protein